MDQKRGKATIVMVIFIIAFLASAYISQISPAKAQTGGLQIDVFTNKAPFNGKGANQTSDAFSPYETIKIYATVTFNGDPVGSLLVSFWIQAPTPTLSQPRVATTNQTGLASIEFNVVANNVSQTAFGIWFVLASTSIGGLYALDTLTFRVGYIVTATMSTVDPSLYPQQPAGRQNFTKNNEVGLLITLTNIAMTSKNVTMAFVVEDAMNQILYTSSLMSLTMPPGNLSNPLITFSIPSSAATGTATIVLSLFNQVMGKTIPYAPEAITTFKVILIDVAVTNAALSSSQVQIGQLLTINATVKNLGELTEAFNATIYYNETTITTFNVSSLRPGEQGILTYQWNTSQVGAGTYTITVTASQVPDETNTANNVFTAGQVTLTEASATTTPFNPRNLYIILWIIFFIFLIALLALLVLRRRKKEEPETPDELKDLPQA